MKYVPASLILLITLLTACSQDNDNDQLSAIEQAAISRLIFSDDVTDFNVKVFYEMGAAPYTGALATNDTWDVTEQSFTQLFQTHAGRTITVPHTLAEMQEFPPRDTLNWTASGLIVLGQSLDYDTVDGNKITLPIIIVNGYFNGNSEILGVHFTGLPFAFVFKDVVKSLGGTALEQAYIEQATVVHEIGHMVGLVNSGVPMVDPHEDVAHPHHSTDTDCVMSYRLESKGLLLSAVADYILTSRLNLFGAKTLQDGQAFHP